MKILIVANNCSKWRTWDAKLAELKNWFAPKVAVTVDLVHVSFPAVPWLPYESIDANQQGEGWFGIDGLWFDEKITPLAVGYDAVLFVLPRKEWKDKNKARGWRTDYDQGPVQLQIGCDEHEKMRWDNFPKMSAFFQLARHEILHAMYMITGQYDMTHYYWDRGQLDYARDTLIFPNDYRSPALARTIAWLTSQLNRLKAEKSTQPPLPEPEIILNEEPMPETPEVPKKDLIKLFCEGIKAHEGWYVGSRSYRNNNPGNFRCSAIMNARATSKDKDGFCVFPTYAIGMEALEVMVRNAATGKSKVYRPEMSIYDFFNKYAPSADHNDPNHYAEAVAARLGVPASLKLSQLV